MQMRYLVFRSYFLLPMLRILTFNEARVHLSSFLLVAEYHKQVVN